MLKDCQFNDDVNNNFQQFLNCVVKTTDQHVPIKTIKLTHKAIIKPWITKELKDLIKTRQTL